MEDLLDYVISPAGPADALELGRVHVRCWRQTYPGILPQAALNRMNAAAHARRFHLELVRAQKGQVTLIAEGPDGAVGYASGALARGDGRGADAEVFTLYVLRQAQGAGVGRALLRSAARVLQAEGAKSLMLFVLTRNDHARGFYERLGGEAFAEVASKGWGDGLTETAYRWKDIGTLAG
ncbi:MAG TPA: GNAT family N-acetyltransferase [Caulobacteraceae bacterium]|nr:GNAT family N-acetyltransferase [Caulobacteraceae bacterium]